MLLHDPLFLGEKSEAATVGVYRLTWLQAGLTRGKKMMRWPRGQSAPTFVSVMAKPRWRKSRVGQVRSAAERELERHLGVARGNLHWARAPKRIDLHRDRHRRRR